MVNPKSGKSSFPESRNGPAGLSENAERHSQSRENDQFPYEIRDLPFGLRRRPTHRAVFTIRGEEVVVLTIRHVARRDLSPDDIESG